MRSHEELAWAAGFVDGDGTIAYNPGGYVSLHSGGVDPEPLLRLQDAVGCGNVTGPYDRRHPDRWSKRPQFYFQAYAGGDCAVAKLWFALGAAKREQALAALNKLIAHRGSGETTEAFGEMRGVESGDAFRNSLRLRLAWAAGFFDAEGCFSSTARVGVSASITQTDRELLDRFQSIVGCGKIYGPYATHASDRYLRKPHYFFKAHGRERVQALLAMLWIWLGAAKKLQAIERLDWTTTCRMGHAKKLGHTGCAECTRSYWAAYRAKKREDGVREPAFPYLLAG
jgi:hypothetical protein